MDQRNDIVVADDNPLLRRVLAEIFRESAYTVRAVSDGFAALATIRERVPDVLISDLNMPLMSGFELLSIVRRRFPSIAVVAMSGAYSVDTVPQGVAADAFYAKGANSIARFFEILRAIKDETVRHSMRSATPIWIHGVLSDPGDRSILSVACPECLRTFSHRLHDAKSLRAERCCPHCMHPVQLAIVGPHEDMDCTCPLLLNSTGDIREFTSMQ